VATALILATAILSMKSFNISASTIRCWIAEGEPYLCEKKGEFAGNGGRGLGQLLSYCSSIVYGATLCHCCYP
jgi:hypothetical protein